MDVTELENPDQAGLDWDAAGEGPEEAEPAATTDGGLFFAEVFSLRISGRLHESNSLAELRLPCGDVDDGTEWGGANPDVR